MTNGAGLPQHLIDRASHRGGELAWTLDDIPEVIRAARDAKLVNVGGHLQYRFQGAGTCECYWIEVDTYKSVSTSLPWQERVDQTAAITLADFSRMCTEADFLTEGRNAFPAAFAEFEGKGQDATQARCFVWYAEAPGERVINSRTPQERS